LNIIHHNIKNIRLTTKIIYCQYKNIISIFVFSLADINNIMAKVQLSNVVVLDNPSPFLNPFQFELTFECIEDLNEGIIKE